MMEHYRIAQCHEVIEREKLDLIATTGKEDVIVAGSCSDGNPDNNLSNLSTF